MGLVRGFTDILTPLNLATNNWWGGGTPILEHLVV